MFDRWTLLFMIWVSECVFECVDESVDESVSESVSESVRVMNRHWIGREEAGRRANN